MYVYLIIIILILLFYVLNENLNYKENFIDILSIFKEPKKNNTNTDFSNKKCPNNEIKNLFRTTIFVSYSKNKSNYFFNILNSKYELFLKINYTFNEIFLKDINNKQVGFLINNKYNKYYFDLDKLYNSKFYMVFINGYDKLNIYSIDRNIDFIIKKSQDKFDIYDNDNDNDICIGDILFNESNYKINIERSKKEYLNLCALGLSLFIKNN